MAERTDERSELQAESGSVMKNKLRRTTFLLLVSIHPLVSYAATPTADAGREIQPTNEAVAMAYKHAITQFIEDVASHEDDELAEENKVFMASLSNYRSEVAKNGDGFCIAFSPREFQGSPVFGGRTDYCFNATGTVLQEVRVER